MGLNWFKLIIFIHYYWSVYVTEDNKNGQFVSCYMFLHSCFHYGKLYNITNSIIIHFIFIQWKPPVKLAVSLIHMHRHSNPRRVAQLRKQIRKSERSTKKWRRSHWMKSLVSHGLWNGKGQATVHPGIRFKCRHSSVAWCTKSQVILFTFCLIKYVKLIFYNAWLITSQGM